MQAAEATRLGRLRQSVHERNQGGNSGIFNLSVDPIADDCEFPHVGEEIQDPAQLLSPGG